MPPKKSTTTNGDSVEGGGKFTWDGLNDNKLLLLTQGRYVKPDEYEQLASAFTGTTVGSIRNRISALRVKQRNLYEEMGWEVPEGGAGQSVKKKRGAEGTEEDGKKAKAPRARKGKKVEEVKSAEGEGESEGEIGGGVGVKEEQVEADFV